MRFQCPFCQGVVAVANTDMGTDCQCGHCGEVVSVPTSRVATGSVISDFIILEELGRGGMGVVYLTHQITLDRPSALKILAGAYANNPEFVVDFIKEARAAAKLNHPHIVQAYAVGEDEGIYFFAMEHIDGETMKDYMKREGVVQIEFALEVIQQIAEALDYAWKEQRLVHRDIKPDNIMLTRKGRAKLADLGLARVAGDIDDADSDEVMGTPQYISPEHLTGAEMDVRSDIYSLGATLFHLITGRFAFEGRTATDIARKHLEAPLQSPKEINPAIPESVCRIIIKMMAKNANERYQSAEDLVEDLRLARQGKAPSSSTGAVKKQGKGGKQFSLKKGGGAKTGTYQAATSTGSKTLKTTSTGKTIKTSSTGIRKSPMSTTGGGAKIDKAQAKLDKERKAKNQLIVMVVIVVCVLLAGGGFLIWNANRDKPKTPGTKPNGGNVNIVKPNNGGNKPPEVSPYIKAADELLAFAKSNKGKEKEILSKFDTFFNQNTEPTEKAEQDKRNELMAIYVPIDEKRIKTAREDARRTHVKVLQARKDEAERKAREQAKKAADAKRLKELEERRKQVELEKQKKNKERLEEYTKTQKENKKRMRYLTIYYSSQQKFAEAKKELGPALKEASRAAELYKVKAQEVTDWANKMNKHLDIAAKAWNTLANSGDKFKGTQIEPRAGTLGKIITIKDGVVTVKTFDGKKLDHPFLRLRTKDFKKLSIKADQLLPNESNPAFHFLFASGYFDLAKGLAPEDWKTEFEAASQAYLVKKLQDIEALDSEAEIKNAKRDLLRKAGRTAYIKALKAMQEE